MISMLKSDFYKLFRRKAFYICGLLVGLIGIISVVLINQALPSIKELDLGFNGINSMSYGLFGVNLISSIFVIMFITSEFSYGTIKNIVSRGIQRFSIYLSKVFIGAFVSIIYTAFGVFCAFVSGSIMWGVGEYKQDEFMQILRMLALFVLAGICMQAFYVMIGFLTRHTGSGIGIALGLDYFMAPIFLSIIDYIVKTWSWLGYTINSSNYWVGTYISTFQSTELEQEVINRGIIVCLAYFVVSIAIGIYSFYKRDIK